MSALSPRALNPREQRSAECAYALAGFLQQLDDARRRGQRRASARQVARSRGGNPLLDFELFEDSVQQLHSQAGAP